MGMKGDTVSYHVKLRMASVHEEDRAHCMVTLALEGDPFYTLDEEESLLVVLNEIGFNENEIDEITRHVHKVALMHALGTHIMH